jgi:hypothetical protein
MKKLLLIGLCLCLGGPLAFQAEARQKEKVKYKKHYVKQKLKAPEYTAAASPGEGYTYIREDWSWNPNTSTWEWNGNRWVTAPQPTQKWMPGHWRRTSTGWTWVDGYWK